MTIQRIDVRILLSTLILVTSACASDGGYAGPSGGDRTIAAGSVEDSLSACMSRIPSDASEGQRMIAEQSCERDQANRK
jgi:hypothetical protein